MIAAIKKHTPFKSRDYQNEYLNECHAILAQGEQPLVILGTGGGKTIIGALLALHEPGYVLICCPFVSLINQFYEDLITVGVPDSEIGILQGDNSDPTGWLDQCRVVIAMAQTLRTDRGADFLARNTFHLFIGDERHRGELDEAEYLVSAPKVVGMTATPHRGDGDEYLLNNFVWVQKLTMQDMLDRKWLIDYDHFFYPEDVAKESFLDPAYVFEEWITKSAAPTLGFCTTKEDAAIYAEYFEAQGHPCAVVCDDISDADFKEARRQFNSGEVEVLWSSQKIAIGFNEPVAKDLLVCRRVNSISFWVQMIGRIVRDCKAGTRGKLFDFFNNGRRLPDPRDIVDWKRLPQAKGRTCDSCGLKNAITAIACRSCGDGLLNPKEKGELKEAALKFVDLEEFTRLNQPLIIRERTVTAFNQVEFVRELRRKAFWDYSCDLAWVTEEEAKAFPGVSPIGISQVLEQAIFPRPMTNEDFGAFLAYLEMYADLRAKPSAWIVGQLRSEGGDRAIEMYKIAITE